ncbi:MAG TPA: two-component regulator propeller domain-containing protein, partial [Marinagarivorans sp.]|nr:two-component regulator propeller domain-containing protein [Marinagarivorans sp.]
MFKSPARLCVTLLAVFGLCLNTSWALADDYPRKVSFQNVMQSEDMALGEVEAILQDHEGFMWFGGRNALLRYDGAEFLNITIASDAGQQAEFRNVNQAIDLFEDSRKQLWVATRSGLYIYNREREYLTAAKDAKTQQALFAKNVVSSIDESPGGEILLATWNGVYVFDPHTGQYQLLTLADQAADELIHSAMYDLVVDRQQNIIWLASTKGLIKINWLTKHIKHFLPDPQRPDSLSNNALKTIAQDQQGELWLGADNGLYRFNPHTEQFMNYAHNPSDTRSLTDNMVRHITVAKNGWVWLACQGGLNLFDREHNNFIRFTHEEGQPRSISSSITRRVYEDHNGDIWVGTYPAGVNFYDRSSDAIRVLKPHAEPARGLLSKTVEAITEDKQGQLWIGAGGVTRYNIAEDTYEHYRIGIPGVNAQEKEIKTAEPINALTDSAGDIWFGSWLNGLHLYNRQRDRFEQLPYDIQLASTAIKTARILPDNSVWSVYEDRQQNFWLGTHNAGLLKFDRAAHEYRVFAPIAGDDHSLSNAVVWKTFEDSKGRFWVGTAKGLNIMDRAQGTFKRYEADPNKPHQLANDSVLVIFEDHKGRIWLGTDAGLHLYREATDDFELYGLKQGFVDNGIRSITEDPLGNLWLGTNNGIVMFNADTLRVQNYIRHMGENIGGTSTGASLTTAKGIVAIGSKNGLFLIDVKKLQINQNPPPIAFTELRIFTQKVLPGEQDGILQRVINQTDAVTLDYKKNMLSLHFAALNFRNPDKNRYAYKLEGFDDNWREVGNQRSALYTNLDAGNYVFRVRAANNDGVWNEEGRSIRIIQRAPPWKTRWAYGAYGFISLSMLLLLVRAQFKKRRHLEAQSRLLELKVAERTAELNEKNKAIQAMLSNMRQGLFTLEPDGRIHPEYSRHLEELFAERELAGKNGFELLFAHSNIQADILSQLRSALESMIGEDETNYECNIHLLLNEYEINLNGAHKYLSLDWNPIIEEQIVVKMMVSVRDITALRQMELEAREKKRELEIIGQLIQVPADKYRVLVASCRRFIALSLAQIDATQERDDAVIAQLFRHLHTIKGNSRTYNLAYLSEAAHNAEAYCGQLIQMSAMQLESQPQWDRRQLRADLERVAAVLNEYDQVFTHVLGRNASHAHGQTGIWLDSRATASLTTILTCIRRGTPANIDQTQLLRLEQTMQGALHKSLADVLADIINALPSLAAQLGKATPTLNISAEAIVINRQSEEWLQNIFAHLLRNCLDHGIEPAQLRTALGKPAAGTIVITANIRCEELIITLRDDGQGLDMEKLFQLGVQRNFWPPDATPTLGEIANIIFHAGISSKEQVTEISGRGVG